MILRDYRPEDFAHLCEIDRLCFPPGIAYTAEEMRLYRLIPRRTLPLGPGFRAWLDFDSPRLGPKLSTLIKNLIDGERSLAHLYWAALAESEGVTPTDIEAFVNELRAKGWVTLEERP